MTIRFFYQDKKEFTKEELERELGVDCVKEVIESAERSYEDWGTVVVGHSCTKGFVTSLIETNL